MEGSSSSSAASLAPEAAPAQQPDTPLVIGPKCLLRTLPNSARVVAYDIESTGLDVCSAEVVSPCHTAGA